MYFRCVVCQVEGCKIGEHEHICNGKNCSIARGYGVCQKYLLIEQDVCDQCLEELYQRTKDKEYP